MKLRILLVFLAAFVLATACRKTTPVPVSPVRDADADAPVAPARDASTIAIDSGPPAQPMKRHGVNLSGAEFGVVPGKHGVEYTWDKTDAAMDYFVARGFNHFRIPFRWERLQPKLQGPLDEVEWARLKARVDHAASIAHPLGITIVLVAQNSYRHGAGCVSSAKADPKCKIVSEVEVGDFWGRVALRLKDNPMVWIEATNEPHDMPTEDVVKLGAAVLKEVRRVGSSTVVVLPGGGWGGAWHWDEDFDGTTRSSKAMLAVPITGDVQFDGHLYLDAVGTGEGECVSPTIGEERLTAFVGWLRANGRRGLIGEVAAINTTRCRVAMTNTIKFMEASGDVLDSWIWYGAGAWSYSTIYPLSIGPTLSGQQEKPQLSWIKQFLDSPARAGEQDAGR